MVRPFNLYFLSNEVTYSGFPVGFLSFFLLGRSAASPGLSKGTGMATLAEHLLEVRRLQHRVSTPHG